MANTKTIAIELNEINNAISIDMQHIRIYLSCVDFWYFSQKMSDNKQNSRAGIYGLASAEYQMRMGDIEVKIAASNDLLFDKNIFAK